jgi:glycerate kinase
VKAILAIDSFKGSCTAYEAGEAVRRGILRADPSAVVDNIPVADGGEGTVEAIIGSNNGEWHSCQVTGPLGEKVSSGYGVMKNGTAVIEMSLASGLLLIPQDRLNPLVTTTYGTGELIKHALDAGHRKILIGLGGSGTNDGGAGMAQALGVSFRDTNDNELRFGGLELLRLHTIDTSRIDPRLNESTIICAVDVKNPLCGKNGASAIYGPQKGATPEMIGILDHALHHYAELIGKQCDIQVADMPGAGAAGGLGAGLYAFCGAVFQPGIEAVLDIVGFDDRLKDADFVITGEGRLDEQTVSGKVPVGVARRAKANGSIPVFALVGSIGSGAEAVYDYGVDGIYSIADGPMTYSESCGKVKPLLERVAESLTHSVMAIKKTRDQKVAL